MARTRFDLDELGRVEDAARECVLRIEQRLAELGAALAPLRASWTGDAATAWDIHQRTWDTAAADLAASLGHLHRVLGHARGSYTAAIEANRRMWRT